MYDPFHDNINDDEGTVFRDVILLALAGFVVIVMLLIPHINPIAKKANDGDVPAPGNVIVEINWPNNLDADVDLWVQGPGDDPVGYSNKGGRLFNLLRDDLGTQNDLLELNYENAYSRGVVAGEYIINVHLFRDGENPPEGIPVDILVRKKNKASLSPDNIAKTRVILKYAGQEVTAIRFKINQNLEVIRGSINNIPIKIRDANDDYLEE